MKNFLVFVSLILIIIISLFFNFSISKKQIDTYINIEKNISLMKKENNLIKRNLFNLKNADFKLIDNSIKNIDNILYIILNNKEIEFTKALNDDFNYLKTLNDIRNEKLLKLSKLIDQYNILYQELYDIKISKFKDQNQYKRALLLTPNSNLSTLNEFMFLDNSTIKELINTIVLVSNNNKSIYDLQIDSKIKNIELQINKNVEISREENRKMIMTTIFLFIVVIIIFSIYYLKEYHKNEMTKKFRSAIENSDNIVVMTDYDQRILYVNQSFTDSTGYTLSEIKGKRPSILRSSVMPKTFYKELNETIYAGKKWQGEFINTDKTGHTKYEKASILPIMDNSNKKIEYFLSIKLDITKEVEATQKIKEHEQTILHQSKMASMGEMLENIAHQWRQPLSTITTVASGMSMQKEVGILSDELFSKSITTIMENANYLSKTIDDFRNFLKTEKSHEVFNLKTSVTKALNISESKLKSKFIESHNVLEDINVEGIDGEFVQVILNFYSNAADAFSPEDKEKHYIFTELYKKEDVAVIKVRDNAGGIPEDFIGKVFEPYFTTKHKMQGTGIGLYMCHAIIQNTFKGTIDVHNIEYDYEGKKLKGAEFIVKIPIYSEKS